MATRNTTIEGIGVYLPPKAVSTREVLQGCDAGISYPLERLTGIKSRRMAGVTEFSIDLARKAIAKCLQSSRYAASDIELLICCNISRCDGPNFEFSFEPSTSVRLRHEFGMDNAISFDVANACAGMFTGILVADCYLRSGIVKNALVASGEYITHLTATAQKEIAGVRDPRMACLTLGDAGAAVTLAPGTQDGVGFHDIEMYTVGAHSDLCVAKTTDREHGGAIMLTDSEKIHTVAIQESASHIVNILKRNGWPRGDFHFLAHQTARTAISELARCINKAYGAEICRADHTIYNLERRGNTASTTHVVALWDSIMKDRIHSGDNILFAVQASGITVGAAPYTFDDLPDRVRAAARNGNGRSTRAAVHPNPAPRREKNEETLPRVQMESVGVVGNGRRPRDAVELARIAGEDCLRNSTLDRSQIDAVLHAGVHRDGFLCEPAIAAILAGKLQVGRAENSQPDSPRPFAFDVMNGALSFLNACHLAVTMIRAGKHRRIMVAASEVENNAGAMPDRLLGIEETASAAILKQSGDGRSGFGRFLFKYFTQHVDLFRSFIGQERGASFLNFRRNQNIETVYLDCVAEAVDELLAKEGLDRSDLRVVVPPQISSEFIGRFARRLNILHERCVDVVQNGKDFFTSSLAYAMRHAMRRGMARAGDVGLIVNVGTGIQVGCVLYYF